MKRNENRQTLPALIKKKCGILTREPKMGVGGINEIFIH